MVFVSMNLKLFCSFSLPAILLLCTSLLHLERTPTATATTLTSTAFDEGERDRLALLAIMSQITSDPLRVTSSWNDSLHFCKWQGIACGRRHRRVTVLDLQSQGLVGSVSPAIGNLTFLVRVNLQNNSFGDEIPPEVGRLFGLKELDLRNNSLEGKIPVNLSRCSNLQRLLLSFNKLTGKIPVELGSLSKLVVLRFFSNELMGEIPASFGNLSLLETLGLSYNSLGGSIPDSLGRMKSLKKVGFTSNIFSGMIPPSLYNISSIEIFAVPSNQLNGSLPPGIGLTLPNLQDFLIGENHFLGSIPVSLFNASWLERVDIDDNNFSGQVPVNVNNLKSLQVLRLDVNNLGSGTADDLSFLTALINCSNLRELDISFNKFGGMLPNSISNLSITLGSLYVVGNQIYGSIPEGIENLSNLIVSNMKLNMLTGHIPIETGMLQKLQSFSLHGNQFSGKIPSSLGNISLLYLLDLSNNILDGNIPSNLGNYRFLQILDLSQNNLNGMVTGLPSPLISFNLAHNSLTGPLSLEVGNLKNLVELDVSENRITGEIPSTLASCLSLEHLCIEGNFFQGAIPPFLGSLTSLKDLDLARHNFSGQIPNNLANLTSLRNLNLSLNNLEGEVPIDGVFKNKSAISIIGNKKLCGGTRDLQLPACSIKKSKQARSLSFKITIITVSTILSLALATSFLTLYWRRKPAKEPSSTTSLGDGFFRVSYYDLLKATGGFSSENLIGAGSFGSVYKGILHQDGLRIAVKVLNLQEPGASKSFMDECEALREIRHRNLLKILTACLSVDFEGNNFKALVYELMPNGSLENWVHSSEDGHLLNKLSFEQRLNIAIDIASALDYLHHHCQTPIVHCDLKPSNVLLDDDMVAHVGDFGLAKFLSNPTNYSDNDKASSVAIKGSIGFVSPEYGMGAKVSIQGDVYSFGILLLELFTGKRPTNDIFKDGLSIHNFSKIALPERVMEIVDPSLCSEEEYEIVTNIESRSSKSGRMQECLVLIVGIGVACSTESPGKRLDI